MELSEDKTTADTPFCRLCFNREGVFRKIENIDDEVLSNRIIPYLMEKHLHVKIFEVSFSVCEECCGRLFAFEDFYAKVRLHVENFYATSQGNGLNGKPELLKGIVFHNPFDISQVLPRVDESVDVTQKADAKELSTTSDVKIPVNNSSEDATEPTELQRRVTRSSTLRKTTVEQRVSRDEKPKAKKIKPPPEAVFSEFKTEPEREIPEKRSHQRSTELFGEFDFREDDSDSDATSHNSEHEEWPGGVNLDDFPKQIIENGLLKVKGKELMTLISKFYNLECNLCEKEKPKFKDLKDLFSHHTEVHNKKGHVMCCSTKFNRYPAIIMHMVRHIQPDAFRCDTCGYMVTRPRFLESHKKTHLPEEEKPFACDQCPRRFCWKSAFQVHKLSHQPRDVRKHFVCHICGRVYDTPGGLCSHRKLAHTNFKSEPHVCHVCAKKFATRTGLNEHMATIHQPREKDQVQCQKCGKWLMNNRCLKSHMILHSSNLFSCKVCDYTTKKESLLRRHQLTQHSDEKPFVCTICSRAFKLKRALTVHVAQHENSKQYKCTFCERIFNSSTNFYTHRKTVHPEELNALKKAKLEEQRQKRIDAGVEDPDATVQVQESQLVVVPSTGIVNPVNYSNINQQMQTYQFIDQHGGVTTIIAESI